jgi:pimeloyl-ACP methyl ester carboxylesterase
LVPPWPPPSPSDTLTRYAARFAGSLVEAGVVRRPFVLGGNSFGGMVAWEMARLLKPDALVLLGSASSTTTVRAPLRPFLPLARLLGPRTARLLIAGAPLVAPLFGVRGAADRALFVEMLRSTPPAFFAFALKAIAGWTPSSPAELSDVSVLRLHGSDDHIIGPDLHGGELVAGAGHVLTLTHGDAVNAFLARVLASVARNETAA